MAIRDMEGQVEDRIPVKNVLVSVFDKTGLDKFAQGIVAASPDVRFLSTGGTFKRLYEIFGNPDESRLLSVEKYTGAEEMEGGLVKTLHPLIHGGILGERNNPAHQEYLNEMGGTFIDMVVVNLYPFQKVIAQEGVTFEKARGNIDIGGPTMLRAAAKNFPSCAAVCMPSDYEGVVRHVVVNEGSTEFSKRLWLARDVFDMSSEYDGSIKEYFYSNGTPMDVEGLYTFRKEDDS